MKWKTFYGVEIDISQLSHQHLSNIKWFYEITCGLRVPVEVQYEIDKRFGGIQLPYHPLRSFELEINMLESKGYITNRHDSDVVVDGKWIGKILYQ